MSCYLQAFITIVNLLQDELAGTEKKKRKAVVMFDSSRC